MGLIIFLNSFCSPCYQGKGISIQFDFPTNSRKHAYVDEFCQRMNKKIMIAERLELKTAPL